MNSKLLINLSHPQEVVLQKNRTLVLDGSYVPLTMISWKRAMYLLVSGKAEMVEDYQVQVRTVNKNFYLPKILRLYNSHSHKRPKVVNFSRWGILSRDRFTCGYCGGRFKSQDLTLDHVIPASQGGKKSWDNIITACMPCNNTKGGRTPEQAGLILLIKPHKPMWTPDIGLRINLYGQESNWRQWFTDNNYLLK